MKIELCAVRPCMVRYRNSERKGLVHGIFQGSEICRPSGSKPGGVVAAPVAVVELEDGRLIQVLVSRIRFLDRKFDEYDFTDEKEKENDQN